VDLGESGAMISSPPACEKVFPDSDGIPSVKWPLERHMALTAASWGR